MRVKQTRLRPILRRPEGQVSGGGGDGGARQLNLNCTSSYRKDKGGSSGNLLDSDSIVIRNVFMCSLFRFSLVLIFFACDVYTNCFSEHKFCIIPRLKGQ